MQGINPDDNMRKMEDAVKVLLECIGENPDREGLIKTPRRMAKALIDCTKGYKQDLEVILAVFRQSYLEQYLTKTIMKWLLLKIFLYTPFVNIICSLFLVKLI